MSGLLSACLIVKDEATTLPRCLASLAGVADEVIVVDTGSSDGTVAIAEAHGARVFHAPWNDDFAAARNVSLAHATGTFILYVDADEELHADDREALLDVLRRDVADAVEMAIVSRLAGGDKTSITRYVRVFRNYPDVKFVHRIHEQIWPSLAPHDPRLLRSMLRIVHHGYDQPEAVLAAKRERNRQSALRVLETEPDNPFYLYHAGIGYLTTGEPESARPWLERALRLAPAREQPMIKNALAQACFDLKHHHDAERHLRASVDEEPQQHHGWALLADVLLIEQRHADAVAVLRSALAVSHSELNSDVTPNPAVQQLKLGMCELLTHDASAAVASLERALEGTLTEDERATGERYLAMARRMAG